MFGQAATSFAVLSVAQPGLFTRIDHQKDAIHRRKTAPCGPHHCDHSSSRPACANRCRKVVPIRPPIRRQSLSPKEKTEARAPPLDVPSEQTVQSLVLHRPRPLRRAVHLSPNAVRSDRNTTDSGSSFCAASAPTALGILAPSCRLHAKRFAVEQCHQLISVGDTESTCPSARSPPWLSFRHSSAHQNSDEAGRRSSGAAGATRHDRQNLLNPIALWQPARSEMPRLWQLRQPFGVFEIPDRRLAVTTRRQQTFSVGRKKPAIPLRSGAPRAASAARRSGCETAAVPSRLPVSTHTSGENATADTR